MTAREEGFGEGVEAAAKVAGWCARTYDDTKAAHRRFSKEPFNPVCFGFDMELVKWSRSIEHEIRALTPPTDGAEDENSER